VIKRAGVGEWIAQAKRQSSSFSSSPSVPHGHHNLLPT
jgi:hypothetical protein